MIQEQGIREAPEEMKLRAALAELKEHQQAGMNPRELLREVEEECPKIVQDAVRYYQAAGGGFYPWESSVLPHLSPQEAEIRSRYYPARYFSPKPVSKTTDVKRTMFETVCELVWDVGTEPD